MKALSFTACPRGAAASSDRAAQAATTPPHAAQRAWAPAHLPASVACGGDISLAEIRCARIGGDAWGSGEPPLGAPTESYVVEIVNGEDVVRTAAAAPSFLYSVTDQTADFGEAPALLRVRVAQMGESGASGLNSELTITL